MVLLDIMLPDISGYELCEQIRKMEAPYHQTPIIFLTAKGESIDKLRGFNLGVDDYLVKPLIRMSSLPGLRPCFAALFKRLRELALTAKFIPKMAGDRQYRHRSWSNIGLQSDGNRIELTPKEIELLYFLTSNPSRVFTREDLLGYVWNFDFTGGTRTVDAHVKNLRKKLGQHDTWNIQTLWGIGYSFEVVQHV